MDEQDLAAYLDPIKKGTATFDTEAVARGSTALAAALRDGDVEIEARKLEKKIKSILVALRRRGHFAEMQQVSRAYLDGLGTQVEPPLVRTQNIQALIDQKKLAKALEAVDRVIAHTKIDEKAGTEARGLRGRIFKQRYVDAADPAQSALLKEAIASYDETYLDKPETNWWHGINVVACLARAERDGIPLDDVAHVTKDWKAAAKAIFECTSDYEPEDGDYTWAMGTALEACVALGKAEDAHHYVELYLDAPWADRFELSSTERQLREVWQLDVRDVGGLQVLPILTGKLGTLGASIRLRSGAVAPQGNVQHQAQLGKQCTKSIQWLDRILARARWVGKVSLAVNPSSAGTGFIVAGREIGGDELPERILVTNHHVLNEKGIGNAMRPDEALVNLTLGGKGALKVKRVIWEDEALDVALCEVSELPTPDPAAGASPLEAMPVGRTNDLDEPEPGESPRLYVVGHPSAGELQISMYDNHMIGRDDERVQYRSPTQEGSSGSPVMTERLAAVALHHGTRTDREANQGTLLDAIRTKYAGYLAARSAAAGAGSA